MPNNSIIYQFFLGRHAYANVGEHKSQVLHQLMHANWRTLHQHNFTHVYLTGIWDNHGEILVNQEGDESLSFSERRLPSPFAITDHVTVNPTLGTNEDLLQLIALLHQQQLQVLVDFVPNHTSLAHSWLNEHPEYYHWHEGKLVKEFSGDVAKLNYDHPQVRNEMIKVLSNIQSTGVDGVRVDMAHLIPIDFWTQSISQLNQSQPFQILGEAYSHSVFDWNIFNQLFDAGFNNLYHEFLYRNLNWHLQGINPASDLSKYINYYLDQSNSGRFTSYIMNHDDYLSPQFILYRPALTLLLLMLPGPKLVFNGQLLGLPTRLKHHQLDILPEEYDDLIKPVPEWWVTFHQQFNQTLTLTHIIPLFHNLFRLEFSDQSIFGLINLGQDSHACTDLDIKPNAHVWSLSQDTLLNPGNLCIFSK
jgi:hypothetical protein